MITKEGFTSAFEVNLTDLRLTLKIYYVFKEDGIEINRSNKTEYFYPADIEKVKFCLGVQSSPEIDYLNSIWTAEVISSYIAEKSISV